MPRITFCLVLLACVIGVSFSHGSNHDLIDSLPVGNKFMLNSSLMTKGTFSFGVSTQYYKYQEKSFMNYQGYLMGAHLGYRYIFDHKIFSHIGARILYGNAHYRSKETGSKNNIPQFMLETRFLLGKVFELSPFSLSPYLGFGYRYKTDDSGGQKTSTNHLGYKRTSDYVYLPIGIEVNYFLSNAYNIRGIFEFDWLIKGTQTSSLTTETITNNQDRGYGIKTEVLVTKLLDNKEVSVGPYLYYWNINKSDLSYDSQKRFAYEPKNHTIEAGIKVQLSL